MDNERDEDGDDDNEVNLFGKRKLEDTSSIGEVE